MALLSVFGNRAVTRKWMAGALSSCVPTTAAARRNEFMQEPVPLGGIVSYAHP